MSKYDCFSCGEKRLGGGDKYSRFKMRDLDIDLGIASLA